MSNDFQWACITTIAWFAFGAGIGLALLAFGQGSTLSVLLIGAAIGGVNMLLEAVDIVDGRKQGLYR